MTAMMDTLTRTETEVEDQVEIPPVCEARDNIWTVATPCPERAQYECLVSCPVSHEATRLVCERHYIATGQDVAWCAPCRDTGRRNRKYLVVGRRL